MPTYERSAEFLRDLKSLTPAQRTAIRAALQAFIADADSGSFRPGLRVKRFRSEPRVWEMTWSHDGRALFRYGQQVQPGAAHIVWLRVGTDEIFER